MHLLLRGVFSVMAQVAVVEGRLLLGAKAVQRHQVALSSMLRGIIAAALKGVSKLRAPLMLVAPWRRFDSLA